MMKKAYCKGCPHLKEVTDDNGSGKKYYRKYCLKVPHPNTPTAKPLEIYAVKICPIIQEFLG